jgi:hypothetical protein
MLHLRIGEDLYIWVPADLDQLGREYSDGALVRRKRLVKLGHMTAYGRRPIDKIDLKAGVSQV